MCLIAQSDDALRQQGYGWASVISEGRDRDLTRLAPVRHAVDAALHRRPMIVVEDEGSPTRSRDLPVAYCAEIVEDSAIRGAIGQAAVRLARPSR